MPSIRTVFQLKVDVEPEHPMSADEKLTRARTVILKWVKSRFPGDLPVEAESGEAFNTELPGFQVNCVKVKETAAWSLRFQHPDDPDSSNAMVGRTWITELCVSRRLDESIAFGIRLQCAFPRAGSFAAQPSRPRVVVELARDLGLSDILPLRGRFWQISKAEELAHWKIFLERSERSLPVILISQRNFHRGSHDGFLLDPEKFARKAQGLAHVLVMPSSLAADWTALVGREWSVFNGAIRTYNAGLRFEFDSISAHPLALAERIQSWSYKDEAGENSFGEFLLSRAYEYAATKKVNWGECLLYSDARKKVVEGLKSEAKDDSNWRSVYEEEIELLESQVKDLESEKEQLSERVDEGTAEKEQANDEIRRLLAKLSHYESCIAELRGDAAAVEVVPRPTSYAEVGRWVRDQLVGMVILHQRAERLLANAAYEDVGFVVDAIVALATEYRDLRLGLCEPSKWETRLRELRLTCSPSISKQRAGEQGETYFVKYPAGSSRREFLNLHLRNGGNTRDPRRCFALYFFWDESTQQVVIGSLPGHLDNRLT